MLFIIMVFLQVITMKALEFMQEAKSVIQLHFCHNVLSFLSHIFLSFFSICNAPNFCPEAHNYDQNNTNHIIVTEEDYEFHWSTSLIPLPLHHTTNAIKKQLPIVEYSSFCRQNDITSGNDNKGDQRQQRDDDECAVCLNKVEGTHLMRELWNCRHVFHKDCLDTWIDKSNVTCPLCLADLLPAARAPLSEDTGGDLGTCPWQIINGFLAR